MLHWIHGVTNRLAHTCRGHRSGINGLGTVRSLGRAGIPAYGLSGGNGDPGEYSRYCEMVRCPNMSDAGAIVESLVSLGRGLPGKSVLFPSGDLSLEIVSEHREALAPFYHFPFPDGAKWIDEVNDFKSGLYYWRQGELTLGQWWASYRGRRYWARATTDDPKPFLVFLVRLAIEGAKSVLRPLVRPFRRTRSISNNSLPTA